jgi:FHS family L-fucose permease-like MFS transporter
LDPQKAAAIAGLLQETYWFLMLIGRFLGSLVGGKVSSKTMLTFVSIVGIILVLLAVLLPKNITTLMPVFTGSSFSMVQVPLIALFLFFAVCVLLLCGVAFSILQWKDSENIRLLLQEYL